MEDIKTTIGLTGELQRVFDKDTGAPHYIVALDMLVLSDDEWRALYKRSELSVTIHIQEGDE